MEKRKEKKKYEIEVIVEASCHVTRYATEDEYDNDDTSTSHYVQGLQLLKEGSYSRYSVPVGFKPVHGVPYHVVCAQYSSGDSFGRYDGQGFEVVGVYRNRDIADENVSRIEKHNEIYRSHEYGRGKLPKGFEIFSIELKSDGRRNYKIHVPWSGYFESLDWVRAETFTLR